MAEFCLECWNRLNGENLTARDVRLSRKTELCEGCGAAKKVVITLRRKYRTHGVRPRTQK